MVGAWVGSFGLVLSFAVVVRMTVFGENYCCWRLVVVVVGLERSVTESVNAVGTEMLLP